MSQQPQNLLIPFRRDKKRDFAVGSGEALLASKVRQALLTEGATARSSGELPWRTNFGAGLGLLRHQRNDAALKELARVYVRDALKRWVPGAQLVSLSVEQDGPALTLRVRVRERDVAAAVAVSFERCPSGAGSPRAEARRLCLDGGLPPWPRCPSPSTTPTRISTPFGRG